MSYRGTCLQTYIPMRKSAESGAEMVSSLLFGESYTVFESQNGFLRILSDFDEYEGWISSNTYAEFQIFEKVVEHIFIEASSAHQIMFLPCGASVPESGVFEVDGVVFRMEKKLKTYNHLPLNLRIQKLALSFLNMPYLWGGRSFMGLDCSGFVQVVFKANGITLPRDTSNQVQAGKEVGSEKYKSCDLVFFRKPNAKTVSHVGLLLDNNQLIHASGKVRCDLLGKEGLTIDGELQYVLHEVRRLI